jgi:glycosyltransferase involved in cell wall biosynthesis
MLKHSGTVVALRMIVACLILLTFALSFSVNGTSPAGEGTTMARVDRKVAFICASGSRGGTEQLVRLYAAGFKFRGYLSEIFALEPANADWLSEKGASVTAVDWTGGSKLANVLKLAKNLRPLRDATINIHYPTFDVHRSHFAAMRLAGCGDIVVSLHHPHLQDRDRAPAIRRELDKCRLVIFTTNENREFAIDLGLVDPDRAVVCLPGVESGDGNEKNASRLELGLPLKAMVVSCVCRVAPEKRVSLLVDAAADANSPNPIYLAIAGEGPESESIREYGVAKLGENFKMLGFLENPHELLAASDLYVMLSDLEGFGLAFIEAASHGVPSIGCAGGGIANAILDGKTGYVVPNENPAEEAARHISNLASDPHRLAAFGEAAREHYQNNYTLKLAVDRYEKALFGTSA